MSDRLTPVALSIAGSDSGAGAGAQVDLLTFSALGVFGTTALTCLTAQNPDGVAGVLPVPPEFVLSQCEQVRSYFHPTAAKTGMLFDRGVVSAVAGFVRQAGIPTVVDPVMVASSGATLLSPDAIQALREDLIPLAALVTPNLDEATILLGRRAVGGASAQSEALELSQGLGVPFLLKGGHATGDDLLDVLAFPDGRTKTFRAERVPGVDTHGSGCTLSAAITALLASGKPLEEAVADGHAYLQRGLRNPLRTSGGTGIRH